MNDELWEVFGLLTKNYRLYQNRQTIVEEGRTNERPKKRVAFSGTPRVFSAERFFVRGEL